MSLISTKSEINHNHKNTPEKPPPPNHLNFQNSIPLQISSPLEKSIVSVKSRSCITPQQMLDYLKPKDQSKYSRYKTNMMITLRHAKVVQKSYGSEKRFFCPPPIVKISGQGWKNRSDKNETLQDLMVFIYIGAPSNLCAPDSQLGLINDIPNGDSSKGITVKEESRSLSHSQPNHAQNSLANPINNPYANAFGPNSDFMHAAGPINGFNPMFDPNSHFNGFPHPGFPHSVNPFGHMHPLARNNSQLTPSNQMNTATAAYEPQQLNFNGCDYCTAKQLFINDTDKRKHFELHVKCLFNGGTDLGTFSSKRIKVISKPSKKKQTLKNNELSILSGSKIALYNRLRSQTVSTRYLNVEQEDFKASSTEWGAFTIYLLENPEQSDDDEEGFDAKIGGDYIKYGDTVKLVHNETQIALPKMILRRVDKTDASKSCTDPISQMHKCAFEFRYPENSEFQKYGTFYMALSQDNITQQAGHPKNNDTDTITEAAAWTIVSIESVKYSFNDCYATKKLPINPVPIIYNIKKSGSILLNTAMVEINGENFTNNLQVWFDNVPCETIFRCSEILLCPVSHFSLFKKNSNPMDQSELELKKSFQVNITIVREDGVLFPTHQKYTYENLGMKRNSMHISPKSNGVLQPPAITQNRSYPNNSNTNGQNHFVPNNFENSFQPGNSNAGGKNSQNLPNSQPNGLMPNSFHNNSNLSSQSQNNSFSSSNTSQMQPNGHEPEVKRSRVN